MKLLSKIANILSIMLISIILISCGNKDVVEETTISTIEETTVSTAEETTSSITEETLSEIVDREGNTVEIPEKADRIVSLAPSITETLINLGLGDKLVAVDTYSADVEGISSELPKFDIMTPDAELIVALEPDIIFGTGMSMSTGSDPFAPMVEMGTFVTVIPTSTSIEGILDDIAFIGDITATSDKAQEISTTFINEITSIVEVIDENQTPEIKTVFFETSPAPSMYTFGSNVFLNEYLDILGVKNIFDDQDGWVGVSEEQVIEKDPDIIFTNAGYLETPVELIKSRAGWENINAIKNNQVFLIDNNSSARPNENSIKALQEMAKFIYPDLF